MRYAVRLALTTFLLGAMAFAQTLQEDSAFTLQTDKDEAILEPAIAAYRAGRIPQAKVLFQRLIQQNPLQAMAKVYLGYCYLAELRTSSGTVNETAFQNARKQFQDTLDLDPENRHALQGLGHLYQSRAYAATDPAQRDAFLEQAGTWFEAQAQSDMWSREALIGQGLVAWQRADGALRADGAHSIDKRRLATRWLPVLEKGEQALRKAIKIDPRNPAPKSYLALLLRTRSAMQPDAAAAQRDTEQAEALTRESQTPANPSGAR